MSTRKKYDGLEIAIIGISGHFPGSADYRQFWQHLKAGKELLTTYSKEELLGLGVPEPMVQDETYVGTVGVIGGKDRFDSRFFGYNDEEASVMDPQIRLFHEHCWKALDDAGYSSDTHQKKIGLFAGASANDYWKLAVLRQAENAALDPLYLNMLASPSFISSLIAYKLNLTGPAIYVDSACSTSLVAVDMACRSLLTRACSVALAGGISLKSTRQKGYLYKEGMVRSKDGHCRPFDAESSGTASGEGVGVVVLRRLSEAIADGDHIYAIIRGSYVNNDGHAKVGFTAPGVEGQAECVRRAIKLAGIRPTDISYVEAHGTATRLGDPIEISALNLAYDRDKDKYCAIGSVKSNIGHLDAAAGVAGLIKTALCLQHRQLPASLHFRSPNAAIDFADGPFEVNTSLRKWPTPAGTVRRAGLSSMGMGGTNAHVILEEAPPAAAGQQRHADLLVTLSAKTPQALARYAGELAEFLRSDPGAADLSLADMAYTLQTGRRHFHYRRPLVFDDKEELLQQLDEFSGSSSHGVRGTDEQRNPLVFLFPGQGSQYANMGLGLYQDEPVFREEMEKGFVLALQAGIDLREVLFSPGGDGRINETRYAQPLLFLFEYALARLLLSLGIKPAYMIGHSIGEYTAACIAGVFSLKTALYLVIRRGELMSGMPRGIMVSVPLSEQDARSRLTPRISLAAVNAPGQVVLSGEPDAMEVLMGQYAEQGVPFIKLHTSHAFHSPLMEPMLEAYRQELEGLSFGKPELRFISNLTGRPITAEEACSPDYWVRHLRHTVEFSKGIHFLLSVADSPVFLEVGAGTSLSSLVGKHDAELVHQGRILHAGRHPQKKEADTRPLTRAIGELWSLGMGVDWTAYYRQEVRQRVSLPTYSFEPTLYPAEVDIYANGFVSPVAVHVSEGGGADGSLSGAAGSSSGTAVRRPGLAIAYQSASTPIEQGITGLLERMLAITPIGINDDFFELGGDSLKAMALVRQVNAEFRSAISLEDFFTLPTAGGIAQKIASRLPTTFAAIAPAVSGDSGEGYVLSSAQRRLWVLSRLDGGSTAYHMPGRFLFRGVVDEQAMDRAFLLLVDRHAILRTVFREDERGVPRQVVLAAAEAGLRLSRSAAGVGEPFDLRRGPLLRAGLYRTGEQEWVFYYEMHHIISDGWSLGVLTRELLQLYDSQVRAPGAGAVEAGLAPLRIQYKDYACWQQQRLQSGALSADRDYWLERLGGELPVMELAGDRPRPSVRTYKGGTVRRVVSGAVRDGLEELCRQEGCTLFMGLLAAVNVLLYRYTDQNDILVGSPVAGREHADLEGQIGFYVNTLVLRNRVEGEQSFRALLREFRRTTLEAYAHQHYPFDELVDALPLRRDMSRNPLFDVLIDYAERKKGSQGYREWRWGNLDIEPYGSLQSGGSKFDLTFFFSDDPGELLLTLEYNSDLFLEATAERLADHLKNLVAVLSSPDAAGRRVDTLNFIDPGELRLLEQDFARGPAVVDADLLPVITLFERQAVGAPELIALDLGGRTLTYGELDGRATGLALYLSTAYGIRSGDFVGVLLERSEEMIIVLLAILKTGAAYVPIEPGYPAARRQFIIDDAQLRLLITEPGLTGDAGFDPGRTLSIAQPEYLLAAELYDPGTAYTALFRDSRPGPGDTAYLLYTSGSTGEPKGCIIGNRSLSNYIVWANGYYFAETTPHFNLFTPLSFDLTVTCIFCALTRGGHLGIFPGLEPVTEMLERYFAGSFSANAIKLTPAHIDLLPRMGLAGSRLSVAILGGEQVAPRHIAILRKLNPRMKIYNEYGPTEATVGCTAMSLEEDRPVLVGRPISGAEIFVLGKAGQLQPIGVPGEICIGGLGLARGYWRRPELTAQKFIGAGRLLYRSGDLGRWRQDGQLECLGRTDNQVKIRGYRIELGEVEAVLGAYPGVTGSVVLVRSGAGGEKELAGYVTGDRLFTSSELMAHMGDRLPAYMVPGYYIQLDELPLTANGKVDRRQLASAAGETLGTAAVYEAPQDELEEQLVRIWQEVLEREKVGVRDNFFELGGNSIRAVRLTDLTSRLLHRTLPLMTVFKYPTIRDMVGHFSGHPDEADELLSEAYLSTSAGVLENTLDILQAGFPTTGGSK